MHQLAGCCNPPPPPNQRPETAFYARNLWGVRFDNGSYGANHHAGEEKVTPECRLKYVGKASVT